MSNNKDINCPHCGRYRDCEEDCLTRKFYGKSIAPLDIPRQEKENRELNQKLDKEHVCASDDSDLMRALSKEEYTCEVCGKTYEKGWTDKEAEKEAKEIWGQDNASERKDFAVVCDDCFKKRTPEKVKEMGKEYQATHTQKEHEQNN